MAQLHVVHRLLTSLCTTSTAVDLNEAKGMPLFTSVAGAGAQRMRSEEARKKTIGSPNYLCDFVSQQSSIVHMRWKCIFFTYCYKKVFFNINLNKLNLNALNVCFGFGVLTLTTAY